MVHKIGRRAAYEAMGESPEVIDKHMLEYPDELAIVVGDETRLRQIITNLARCVPFPLSPIFPTNLNHV